MRAQAGWAVERGIRVKTQTRPAADEDPQLQTMSFGEHLEELRGRILRALLATVLGVVVALIFQDELLRVLSRPHQRAMSGLVDRQEAIRFDKEVTAVRDRLVGLPAGVGTAAARAEREAMSEAEGRQEAVGAVQDPAVKALLLDLYRRNEEQRFQINAYTGVRTAGKALEARLQAALVDENLPTNARDPLEQSVEKIAEILALYEQWPRGAVVPGAETDEPTFRASQRELENAGDRLQRVVDRRHDEIPLKVLKYTDSFFAHIKVSLLAGLVLGLPWLTLELWRFIAAGLYPSERRSVRPFLPISLLFLALGGAFAYYVLAPVGLTYLGGYGSQQLLESSFTLRDYISLLITLVLGMALVFQLPLVMVFLSRAGFVEVELFRKYRKFSILGALAVGALLTPPDVVTQSLMAGPLVILYETGILASEFLSKKKASKS